MKKLLFITGILLLSVSCRGPLAKQDASANVSETKAADNTQSTGMTNMTKAKTTKVEIKIEPAEGCITVGDLFSKMKEYSGKTVKIKGKITKVNPAIMGKNWIHIQDGTAFEEQYDLTVTSDVIPEVGSIVIIEGKIALDKDFGYGYAYPIIMEEGKIIK